MSDDKRMLVMLVLSCLVLWGFNLFMGSNQKNQIDQHAAAAAQYVNQMQKTEAPKDMPRESALSASQRIPLHSGKLRGSINLKGAKVDDLILLDYPQTTSKDSSPVVLLSPKETKEYYYAQTRWASPTAELALPDENTPWVAVNPNIALTPQTPVTVRWASPAGVVFERTFAIDERYMITIFDRVLNHSGQPIQIAAERSIVRCAPEKKRTTTSVHEGGIGYFGDGLKEVRYDKLLKGTQVEKTATNGWAGFTDKYWLTAFVIKDTAPAQVRMRAHENHMECTVQSALITLADSKNTEYRSLFFAGAKVLKDLDSYAATHQIEKFDLAVDFGWFYFLTKPLFYLLQIFHKLFHNLGVAIIVLTILTKIISYPLAKSSYVSMARMKEVQPKVDLLKKRYGDDKVKMNEEMLKLYRKHKISPASGCLPLLLQMPIFFCLYKVFTISIEMRHAPFALWIRDLSAPDPTNIFTLFGLLPWSPPSMLQIGILPLIMGASMLLQQKLTPQPADPMQAKMAYIMPLVFLFMFASFPAGLVLYWTVSNILSIGQQIMMRKNSKLA